MIPEADKQEIVLTALDTFYDDIYVKGAINTLEYIMYKQKLRGLNDDPVDCINLYRKTIFDRYMHSNPGSPDSPLEVFTTGDFLEWLDEELKKDVEWFKDMQEFTSIINYQVNKVMLDIQVSPTPSPTEGLEELPIIVVNEGDQEWMN